MNRLRWLDHLPAWLAFGALASTGIFHPGELAAMATPLILALATEGWKADLRAWERWLQGGALAYVAILIGLGTELVPGTAQLLFFLTAIRLALPRHLAQRRQILLMGFLLFLLGAVASPAPGFALWMLAWLGTAASLLMTQAWEGSAQFGRSLPQKPPLRQLPALLLSALGLGILIFALLPRISAGLRPPGWARWSSLSAKAGLSDRLNLGGRGPIQASGEVVLRIVPRDPDPGTHAQALSLLRGIALETWSEGTWSPAPDTPPPTPARNRHATAFTTTFYLAPHPLGLVPHPYGMLAIRRTEGLPLRPGSGGSLRWLAPPRRVMAIDLDFQGGFSSLAEPLPTGRRRARLLDPGPETSYLEAWSRTAAPADLPPRALALALETRLRTFTYSLENPSGHAANPLRDFLEHTREGHCEYFASAMALMLRQRGVPARVVNGFRLGPWIEEGGYFLVTQDQAHSWVEFYDAESSCWVPSDPTPGAPGGDFAAGTWSARFARALDTLRFRWERYVVRLSDEDQMAAFGHLRQGLAHVSLPAFAGGRAALVALLAALFLWRLGRRAQRWQLPARSRPGHLPHLKPLVRATRRIASPSPGETVRDWLSRLATLRPDRARFLSNLADAAEAQAYGGSTEDRLTDMARTEARAWKGWRPPPASPYRP